eukprot:5868458-Pyramimonas_sp.AAC.1
MCHACAPRDTHGVTSASRLADVSRHTWGDECVTPGALRKKFHAGDVEPHASETRHPDRAHVGRFIAPIADRYTRGVYKAVGVLTHEQQSVLLEQVNVSCSYKPNYALPLTHVQAEHSGLSSGTSGTKYLPQLGCVLK